MEGIIIVTAVLSAEHPDIPEVTLPWVLYRVVPHESELGTFMLCWLVPEGYDVDKFCDAFVKLHSLGYDPDFTCYTNSDSLPFSIQSGIDSRLTDGLRFNLAKLMTGEFYE